MTEPVSQLREALSDRYRVERQLGQGGMATVYLAQDLKHDRKVAIKVLRSELAATLGPERFQREIRFAARLQHPHILTVHDSGEAGGRLWYSMPYVEGESLRDRLRRERLLPVEDALRIAGEAARALEYAHSKGVVHRDVKPENILLAADGSTLVADFGIARAMATGQSVGGAETEPALTETGMSVGTPAYMSPEQASGDQAVDARTDIWSLAAVLYEMLAGEAPWTGPTAQAVIARRLSTPVPSVRALRAAVPPGADEAIRKALAVVPADRFSTMARFAEALQEPPPTARPPASGPAADARSRPRVAVGAAALAAALALGGALLVTRRHEAAGHVADRVAKVIAVLPFDNLGDSADAYFADGVADEVRTKLGQIAGLEVIARGSSLEYRHSAKRPTEIARELGADYLLTGTVRWEKAAGTNRVRVTPELVEAGPGHAAARSRWGQPFDASLADVFQVQADIAARVADALDVALADSTRRRIAARATENLSAYDEFLKGEAVSQALSASDPATLRTAIGFYERAAALDSAFVPAWVQLSRARSQLYLWGVPDPALGEQALVAAERARRLRPEDPGVHQAFGAYYALIHPIDLKRARAEFEQGLRMAPNNAGLLAAIAGMEMRAGRWDSAGARFTQAALLDPRSVGIADVLAFVHVYRRDYAAATAAADRAVALAPTDPGMVLNQVLVAVAQGRLDTARTIIAGAATRIERGKLFRYLATYLDLYWVLDDEAQRHLLTLPPSAFDDDRSSWGIVRTQLYYLRGDRDRSAVYADSARLAFEARSRAAPADPQSHVFLGLALAYLGRKAEAVREGEQGAELGGADPYMQLILTRIYLLIGEPEKALDHLEPLLRVPFHLSPAWLRIDPTFDPLRNHPRFRRLVEGTA